jgi:hypothetical protein
MILILYSEASYWRMKGRDSSVGKAIGYGLDSRCLIPGTDKIFPYS